MKKDEFMKKALELVENSNIAMVGSIDIDGYPNIKAMLNLETEGIKTIFFSTNTSSKGVSLFMKNPKACVYYMDPVQFKGLMLVGEMKVLSDPESKQRLWREGFEKYYPLGVTDPDYSVFQFTAKWGNYYHSLQNASFEV
jgi:general stress protein 26